MNAADRITLGKARRFARMTSQTLDQLIHQGKPSKADIKALETIENGFTDATVLLDYLLTKVNK